MSSSSRSCAGSDPAPRARLARRAFIALAVVAMAAAQAAPRAWETVEEQWYRLSLGGQPCGWFHEKVERSGDTVRTSGETQMTVGRMGQGVTIRTATSFEETAKGEPIRAEIRKDSGAAPVTATWTFRDGGIDVEEEQGGRRTRQRRPLPPAGWLAPRAADEFVRRRIAAGAKEIRYSTLDPESGPEAVSVESELVGASTATVGGRTVPVTEWRTRNSLIERPSSEFISSDGVLVRSATDLGVGILESRLSTKDEATAPIAPVEVMARTFIALDADGRALGGSRRAELAVRAKDGRLVELPSSGAQRFERTDAASGIVRVDADTGSKATPAEASDARFARASVVADAADPEIRALAERVLKGVPDSPVAKADALRAAVFRHLSRKNLASGFATASECVRSRAGDCTEHAVLLCALLRTQGIPARVASGLLYVAESGAVRNSYGWHMWTQALIDGSWVDLDAVLPGSVRFDASHVLTGTSPADGGSLDTDLARIVDLMGDTEIEVRSIDGRPAAKGAKR